MFNPFPVSPLSTNISACLGKTSASACPNPDAISASFFFTATPRIGRGVSTDRGMNNTNIYGGVLENVPAQELVSSGAIVPPKVVPFETRNTTQRDKYNAHEIDADNLRDIINTFDDVTYSKKKF